MKTTTIAGILALVLLILLGGWFYMTSTNSAPGSGENNGALEEDASETGGDMGDTTTNSNEGGGIEVGVDVSINSTPTSATVIYGASGFSPRTVTIKQGGTVTWTNQGGGDMWVASAQHPTHTAYSGTTREQHCGGTADASFDQCEDGSTYSFTFDQIGSWNYHNHSNSSHFGTVVVVE